MHHSQHTIVITGLGSVEASKISGGRFFKDSAGNPVLYLVIDHVEVGPLLVTESALQLIRSLGISLAEIIPVANHSGPLSSRLVVPVDAGPEPCSADQGLARLGTRLRGRT